MSEHSASLSETGARTQTEGPGASWPPATPLELTRLMTAPGEETLAPTAAQSAVITAVDGPLLVVAGAGSGKTRTMAEKVAWIVSQGLARPDEILGVTFTNKAAAELGHRIRGRLRAMEEGRRRLNPSEAPTSSLEELDVEVSTYHSFAKRLVTDYGLRLGIEPGSPLIGEAEAFLRVRSVFDAFQGNVEDLASGAVSTATSGILQLVSERAEHGPSWARVRESIGTYADAADSALNVKSDATAKGLSQALRHRQLLTVLAEQYEEHKRQAGVLDFGDLIELAVRLAREFPDVGESERARFKYVLLDEFQDTSHAQMELFAELFAPRMVDGELVGARGVTAVGDPNQSIYGFRGASAGQLAAFLARFSAAGAPARQLNLSQAWRNPLSVLDVANGVAGPLAEKSPFERGPSVDVEPLAPSPAARRGEIVIGRFLLAETDADEALRALEQDPAVQSADGAEEFAELLRSFPEPRSEATAIADFVQERRRVPAGEPMPSIAVLARTKAALAPIHRALEERGVPVEVTGLGALLEEPEVVEIVSYLRALTDTGRSDAVVRILSSPCFEIGTADLAAFGDWSRHLARVERRARSLPSEGAARPEDVVIPEAEDVAEAPSLVLALDELPRRSDWTSPAGRSFSEEGLARLREASQLVAELRASLSDDVAQAIHDVEQAIGLDVELAAKPGAHAHVARRHIEAFVNEASTFMQSTDRATVPAFLDWLESAEEHENGLKPAEVEARNDVVQLMSVHASKGLEWDVVIIPALAAGTFPSSTAPDWTKSTGSSLPYDVRGDAASFPVWNPDSSSGKAFADSYREFKAEVALHAEREERRLAYVGFTRSKHTLWLSCAAYAETAKKPRAASPYLDEAEEFASIAESENRAVVTRLGQSTAVEGEIPKTPNPLTARESQVMWPLESLGDRRRGFERARSRVVSQIEQGAVGELETAQGRAWLDEARHLIQRSRAAEARRQRAASVIELPPVISVSNFVNIVDDEQATGEQLNRPMPRKPSLAARKGTTFHAYLEEHYQRQASFDFDEPWADTGTDEELGLAGLAEKFRSSEWAARQAHAVEVLIETKVGGQRIKGRVDAVFRHEDGTWDLVDWKTGRVPTGKDLETKSLQLALYRLGWSQLTGVPEHEIGAAFYYVDSQVTVRPEALPERHELDRMFSEKVSWVPDA